MPKNTKNETLYLDCANGVGALWAKKYFKNIKLINANTLDCENLNHLVIFIFFYLYKYIYYIN